MNPEKPQLKEFASPRDFLTDTVESFVASVDEVVREELPLDDTEWDSGPSFADSEM